MGIFAGLFAVFFAVEFLVRADASIYAPRERTKSEFEFTFGDARVALVAEFGIRCFYARLSTSLANQSIDERAWCMSNEGFRETDPVKQAASRSFVLAAPRDGDSYRLVKVLGEESAFSGQFGLSPTASLDSLAKERDDGYAQGSFEYPPYLAIDRRGRVHDFPMRSPPRRGSASLYATKDQKLFVEVIDELTTRRAEFYSWDEKSARVVRAEHANISASRAKLKRVLETAEHALVVVLDEPPGLEFGYRFDGSTPIRVIDPTRTDLTRAAPVTPIAFTENALKPKTIVRARPTLVGGIELEGARPVYRPLFANVFGRWFSADKLFDVDAGHEAVFETNVTFDGRVRATLFALVEATSRKTRLYLDREGKREITKLGDLPASLLRRSGEALLAPFLVTTTLDARRFSDPDKWHRARELESALNARGAAKPTPCATDPKLFAKQHLEAAYANGRSEKLFIFTTEESCAKTPKLLGPFAEGASGMAWRPESRVTLVRGTTERQLHAGDTLVDAGDYDGDGASELVFLDHNDTEGVTFLNFLDAKGDVLMSSSHVSGFHEH